MKFFWSTAVIMSLRVVGQCSPEHYLQHRSSEPGSLAWMPWHGKPPVIYVARRSLNIHFDKDILLHLLM